ncbi:hypothetical protein PMAYCL1PPCAC_02161, partial [Pristionchus mayeri]
SCIFQMGFLHLLLAALVASAAMAADAPCACVGEVQTIDPIKNPMIFFQQPTLGGVMNGKTCSMDCNFVAHLDANADDDSALQIQILTNKLGDGSMYVDGMNDTVSITSNTPPGVLYARSYDTSITIHFTEGATNNGEFMIVVQKVLGGRPSKPATKPPVTVVPTAPYDPKFTHNPLLVANDIMLVFDLSSNDIEKYKTFARNLIKEMTINPKSLNASEPVDCGVGSRLSLVGLSALSGFDNLYAPYWTTTAEQADGNIGSFVQIGGGNYIFRPIQEKYIDGFNTSITKCENKEKIFILFTSVAPYEYDGSDASAPITSFVDKGVHQILVSFNMDPKNKNFYTLYDKENDHSNIWNFFDYTGGDSDVEKFFNSFLVDSKEPMTCQLTSTNDKVDVVIGKNGAAELVVVNIPPYYDAKSSTPNSNWTTVKHYCNFQETTVRIIKDDHIKNGDTKTALCLRVFYDLETGKDFVSIFSGDPNKPELQDEVVRLTGRDVSGTNFELTDALGSIVFSSDEKNVYDGFRAEMTMGHCS